MKYRFSICPLQYGMAVLDFLSRSVILFFPFQDSEKKYVVSWRKACLESAFKGSGETRAGEKL